MAADPDDRTPDSHAIQQELRLSRPFTLADAIGQEAGNFMQGESPVPRLVQTRHGAQQALKDSLVDGPGALYRVLAQWLWDDEARLSQHVQDPAGAVKDLLETILRSPATFYELVRQADVTWGQLYDSRPHFQQPGQPPHPDDEYTHESVRETLLACLYRLNHPPQTDVEVTAEAEPTQTPPSTPMGWLLTKLSALRQRL
ncbi:hypothetical protein [Leptolyngbya sp. KIOST-1]|uniref:hypothetical protein n=1 Tax=Leptolyngbya sp. KIOST-1 TaxID=1229172 RepID=UPI000A8C3A7C|nr:hypothetical protein [Leptolyngbya sp. KIOST-1]